MTRRSFADLDDPRPPVGRHLMTPEWERPLPEDVLVRARRYVASVSTGVEDARYLLDVLGLLP